jgi:flagellar protein FliT
MMTDHTTSFVIEAYEHLAEVTGRMREAALQEDWDSVIALESECASVYTHLVAVDAAATFDKASQRRKSELICKLLEDDAKIRERMSGQLARIWQLIDGRGKIDRLNSAYGAECGRAARK